MKGLDYRVENENENGHHDGSLVDSVNVNGYDSVHLAVVKCMEDVEIEEDMMIVAEDIPRD